MGGTTAGRSARRSPARSSLSIGASSSSLPALLALLDVPPEEAEWERLDPSQRRQLTLDGVKRLLLRESEVQPLMVLFEDLHWNDGETQRCRCRPASPPGSASCSPWPSCTASAAKCFTDNSGSIRCRQRARMSCSPACSAPTRSLDRLRRALIERTEGNPLFLEESVRMLVETRMLIGVLGGSGCPDGQGSGDGTGHPGRAHRSVVTRGQTSAAGGLRDRQGRALRSSPRHRRTRRRSMSPGPHQAPSRRVPL